MEGGGPAHVVPNLPSWCQDSNQQPSQCRHPWVELPNPQTPTAPPNGHVSSQENQQPTLLEPYGLPRDLSGSKKHPVLCALRICGPTAKTRRSEPGSYSLSQSCSSGWKEQIWRGESVRVHLLYSPDIVILRCSHTHHISLHTVCRKQCLGA